MGFIETTIAPEEESDYIGEQDHRSADVLLATTNLAGELKQNVLQDMGKYVCDIYDEDLASRSTWEENNKRWIKLANQLIEKKNFPWPDAANVKYPLLSTAALQFHARAFAALVPNENVVKARVLGKDPDGQKRKTANRVSKHMSYQILHEMDEWEDELDRAMYVLPIVGQLYKKTYYSSVNGTNASDMIMADDLVVNYHATSFTRAIKTHRIYQDANEVVELMNLGHYIDQELDAPEARPHEGVEDEITGIDVPERSTNEGVDPDNDDGNKYSDTPYLILEAHTYYDLDGDGYKEPYIITVEYQSQKVLRVVARYRSQDVSYNEDGGVSRIKPYEYFTRYGFLPNPESKIYYQGFGQLLGPLNAASNTILNQLIDAGTLANLPAGFLGRGLKLRGGEMRMAPGKWINLPVHGDDIRKNVFPLPYKEPSSVLFQLLGLLLESGKELSSVKDIMTGENPGQNQPYSTSVMVLEQGMKVFSGIYRRLYRAMGQEFRKLYVLNSIFLDTDKYFALMDDQEMQQIGADDYSMEDIGIVPGADPNVISEAHKVMKANSLLQKKAAGLPINMALVTRAVLEAEGHDNIEELMQVEPPQKDPKIALEEAKLQQTRELEMMKLQLDAEIKQFEAFKDYAQAMSNMAKMHSTLTGIERDNNAQLMKQIVDNYKATTERVAKMQEIAVKNRQIDNQQQPSEEEEQPTNQ